MSQDHQWLKSREARQVLRVSDCELAHLRQAGKLRFMKRGNAFLYDAADCEKLVKRNGDQSNGITS